MGGTNSPAGDTTGADIDQLRRNIGLSPTSRVEKMVSLYKQLNEVRGLAIPEDRRIATLQAIDALGDAPLRSA